MMTVMPSRSRVGLVALFSLCMLVGAAIADGAMDTLVSRYDQSVFAAYPAHRQWLDPRISWRNKWKNGNRAQGEAFFLSSTALVPLTDAWHAFKCLAIWLAAAGLAAPFTLVVRLPWAWWLAVVWALASVFGLVFEACYAHLFLR